MHAMDVSLMLLSLDVLMNTLRLRSKQEDLVDLGVTQLAGDFEGFEQEQVRRLGSCAVTAIRTVIIHPSA
jgi:hypothetical protein